MTKTKIVISGIVFGLALRNTYSMEETTGEKDIPPITQQKDHILTDIAVKNFSELEILHYESMENAIPLTQAWRMRNKLAFDLACQYCHNGVQQYSWCVLKSSIWPWGEFQYQASQQYHLLLDADNRFIGYAHRDLLSNKLYPSPNHSDYVPDDSDPV